MYSEIWKPIKGYEGFYEISNMGRVKSLERYKQNHSKLQKIEEKIMKIKINKSGYQYVTLSKKTKQNTGYIHRLIAEAFIDNPNNYNEINHKDENKSNNSISNLEWCTHKYNSNYGTRNKRESDTKRKNSKNILQFKDNKLVGKYGSLVEIEEKNNYKYQAISNCINGKTNTAYGYVWKYE